MTERGDWPTVNREGHGRAQRSEDERESYDGIDEPILRYFVTGHLPPKLARISRPFSDLAHFIVEELPRSPERTVALRKLLEGKDAAVRAAL